MKKTPHLRMTPIVRLALSAAVLVLCANLPAHAQISLATAVDLALHHNPRILVAQADVDRARAAVAEVRDVYLPSLTAGGTGYGKSYGFPLGEPTIVSLQAQSLVFSYSQRDYIRAARDSLAASGFLLAETREAVAEDAVETYLSLEHDAARQKALHEQQESVNRLIVIVQDRLDAGQDVPTSLTSSRLAAAQIRLALLRSEDDTVVDTAHLSHLTGIAVEDLHLEPGGMPAIAAAIPSQSSLAAATSPGIDAAYASSRAKREAAFGDARYLLRPQLSFGAQYSRLSTFNNDNYQQYYGRRDTQGNLLPFQLNTVGVGVQLSVPIFDFVHRAKARESAAEARHSERDADQQRDQFTEGRLRLQRSVVELAARAEIATLDQQLAQQQLDVLSVQLTSGNPNGQQMTPKDEQNARVAEREKFLALLDARFQLQQAQVNLLRQTGELESWLKSIASQQAGSPSTQLNVQPSTSVRP